MTKPVEISENSRRPLETKDLNTRNSTGTVEKPVRKENFSIDKPQRVLVPIMEVLEVLGNLCSDCQTKVRAALAKGSVGPASLEEIVSLACSQMHTNIDKLRNGGNHQAMVRLRSLIAHRAYQAGYSLPQIGKALNRHHTSVLHLLRTRKYE